jgi:SAM-dependent methyltransferase
VSGVDYEVIRASLRQAYDQHAAEREHKGKDPWKLAERAAFLTRLRNERCRTLLEIGAGTGQDAEFFAASGLEVVATDASPAMIRFCQDKGLDARVMDFAALDLKPGSVDAVHAMNCLLHVPNAELPAVLAGIARVLRPGGLFFLGVYGGDGTEGSFPDDHHVPPRFFSFRTDEQLVRMVSETFEVLDFHLVTFDGTDRFQSLTLRRPPAGESGDGAEGR